MLEHMDDVSIEEGKAKPVFGRLLARMIRNIRRNSWTAGDGLKSTRTANGGIISLDRSVSIDTDLKTWRGIVTASGSSVEEHTVKEIDDTDTEITDGRESTIAKAFNKRKGVPIDTIVQVHETEYIDSSTDEIVCYFNIPDGLTANPKDLVASGATADSITYDIESDSEPVEYQASRVFDDTATSGEWYFFDREIIADASGMITNVSAETRTTLPGNGYYETRQDNVLIDQIPNNGVLDFDGNYSPGTDELAVQFSLTGGQDAVAGGANDQLRTQIQAFVDVSGVKSPESAISELYWITLDANTPSATSVTLSDEDWRGRVFRISAFSSTNTVANANSTGLWTGSNNAVERNMVAINDATKRLINNYGSLTFYVDGTDGGKLKAEGGTGSNPEEQNVFLCQASDQISAATHTIT